MKRIVCCCCFTSSIIPIILIMTIMFGSVPKYDIVQSTTNNYIHFPFEDIGAKIKKSIQFNSIFSMAFVDYTADICKTPYRYACNHNEMNIKSMIEESNREVLDTAITKLQNNFIKSCKSFHTQEISTQREIIRTHNNMKILYNFIQNNTDVESIAGRLHKMGIREPFHIGINYNNDIFFTQSKRIIENNNYVVDYITKHKTPTNQLHEPELYNDYIMIHNDIYFKFDINSYEYHIPSALERSTGFKLSFYLKNMEERIVVNPNILYHFHESVKKYTLQQWRHYFTFALYKSVLHQTRTLTPITNTVCNKQVEQYFPLTVCRAFKKEYDMSHLNTTNYIQSLFNKFKTIILNDNLFNLSPNKINKVNESMSRINIHANKCALPFNNEILTNFEKTYINIQTNYVDTIFSIISNQDFQYRRFFMYDSFSKDLVEDFISWGASYINNPSILIVPPTLLHFATKYVDFNSPQWHAMINHVIFHELGHFLQHQLDESEWKSYSKFRNYIRSIYKTASDDTIRDNENFADVIGLYVAFKSWDNHTKTVHEKKNFIISYIRQWCGADTVDYDHGSNRERAILPLFILSDEFMAIFNCTDTFFKPY